MHPYLEDRRTSHRLYCGHYLLVECVSHSKLECKLWRAGLLSAALGTGLWFMPRNVPELVGLLMYLLNE